MGNEEDANKCSICGQDFATKVNTRTSKTDIVPKFLDKYVQHQDDGIIYLHDSEELSKKHI